jgi:hypothetical protein
MSQSPAWFLIMIAACFALSARADVTYEKAKDGDNDFEIVRMTVTPAAEPVPALRHRLLARDIDLKTGNAVPYYYRTQLELRSTMKKIREKFDDDKELSLWYGTGDEATPIAKLPLEKVREASQMFDPIYNNHLRPAFERSDCDWELGVDELRGVDVISFLLPEFQDSREIARMLALRTRLAVAERRYDDAIEIMQHQYRLGHDVAKVPFLVCGLIGAAIDGITNRTLIELIANRDSPNMYWALTELPQPAIDLRPAARFEMDFGPRMFPFLDHAETTEHAPQEWNRLFTQAIRDFGALDGGWAIRRGAGGANDPLNDAKAGVAATGLGLIGYTHAKERLIAQGMDHDRVEIMAVGQVIAIYTERVYRRFSDDYEKLWYVPFADMNKAGDSVEKRLHEATFFGSGEDREILPIVSLLMPAMQAARGAQVQLERDVAALRVIEALRMHAAEHEGQLPKTLDEITAVPVPLNPATGKPFVYRLDGKTAVLELPAGDRIPASYRRYEIQIAAKNN